MLVLLVRVLFAALVDDPVAIEVASLDRLERDAGRAVVGAALGRAPSTADDEVRTASLAALEDDGAVAPGVSRVRGGDVGDSMGGEDGAHIETSWHSESLSQPDRKRKIKKTTDLAMESCGVSRRPLSRWYHLMRRILRTPSPSAPRLPKQCKRTSTCSKNSCSIATSPPSATGTALLSTMLPTPLIHASTSMRPSSSCGAVNLLAGKLSMIRCAGRAGGRSRAGLAEKRVSELLGWRH